MFAIRNFHHAIHLVLKKTFNDFVPHVFIMLSLVAYNFNTGFFSLADPSNQIIETSAPVCVTQCRAQLTAG